MTAVPAYPVRVEGDLDPHLSRWLWLVKWLLAIPHYVVLFVLWIAFVPLTVIAFFAILLTGRYPRAIFDFNVGVLRWSWRVAFYSYSALGTDVYPPFTLAHDPLYPAMLDIAYPTHLSRGLVLVKWWLLALPHYLVVAFFVGGASVAALSSGGLVGVLVLVAAIVLLVRGRYPESIFDFILGMNRWALRVAAYAALMTDTYPPFRLDLGGHEPGAMSVDREATDRPSALPARTDWGVAGVVAVVIGSLVSLVSFGVLALGAAAVVFDQTQRDADGFVMSPTRSFATGTYALVSESVDISVDGPDWAVNGLLGSVKIRSSSDRAVFLGIARESDVDRYLGAARHAVVTDLGPGDNQYVERGSGAPAAPPGEQAFWVASNAGVGRQALTWKVEDGSWRVVVMNADATPSVVADLAIGAELDPLLWIGVGLLGGALLFLLFGGALVYAGIPKRSPPR